MNTKTARISEYDDLIDSRYIISSIEELRAQKEAYPESFDEDEELVALEKFAAEAEEYCDDWHHGATLVRYSYFTEYVRDFLDDCEGFSGKLPNCVQIDWEATAQNFRLENNYSAVQFGTTTYWVR
jgi:hypothetical protein